ncbi:MAG: hypothetical protein Q9M40_13190 [Sulfurimonas sp.]|nr:hypothetical protein [Sulfurimonas sp.]
MTGLEGTKVNTYLIGEHMSVADAEAKLKSAGYDIVANYKSVKKGTTIVFTNAALKARSCKAYAF